MLTLILAKIRSFFRFRENLKQLSVLTDRELADIGLTRGDIETAAWRAANA